MNTTLKEVLPTPTSQWAMATIIALLISLLMSVGGFYMGERHWASDVKRNSNAILLFDNDLMHEIDDNQEEHSEFKEAVTRLDAKIDRLLVYHGISTTDIR